jgi:NAD(P)H dehydrogenase (quinone)
MILVTGAAGKTGRAVIRALISRGESVRAAVFRPGQLDEMVELGAHDAVAGDLLDPVFLSLATKGICTVYYICPNIHPLELEIGHALVEAAVAAGVRHFAYHSVMHPQTESMPHHWQKMRVEELLFESGLPITILQPAAYMQNILASWTTIEDEGKYVVPYPADTRMSLVDLEDVAEAVAIVLTESGHRGAIYELAGPEPLTQTEVGELLSKQLCRPVDLTPISIDEWKRNVQVRRMSPYEIGTLASMFRYYARFGFLGNPNVLGWLLGRQPTSLADFLERMLL